MFICIQLNPTIDRTFYLKKFKIGGTNRSVRSVENAAGKPVNVAEVLGVLGKDVRVLGLACKLDKRILEDKLNGLKINHNFLLTGGSSRTNIKLFDEAKCEITEINDSGKYIDIAYIDLVKSKLESEVKKGDVIVFGGSLPVNWPNDTYARYISQLKQKGIICVLDTSGDALIEGVKKAPYFIKPNLEELETLAGKKLTAFNDIKEICDDVISTGVKAICVSLGQGGAYMFENNEVYYSEPISVEVRSTVGAGDAMLGGILANINKGAEYALKAGTAAAAASLTVTGTGFPDIEIYNDLLKQVKIKRINGGDIWHA